MASRDGPDRATVSDESKQPTLSSQKRASKSESSVIQVIDVRKTLGSRPSGGMKARKPPKSGKNPTQEASGKGRREGGIDLKTMFDTTLAESGNGLGVGAW